MIGPYVRPPVLIGDRSIITEQWHFRFSHVGLRVLFESDSYYLLLWEVWKTLLEPFSRNLFVFITVCWPTVWLFSGCRIDHNSNMAFSIFISRVSFESVSYYLLPVMKKFWKNSGSRFREIVIVILNRFKMANPPGGPANPLTYLFNLAQILGFSCQLCLWNEQITSGHHELCEMELLTEHKKARLNCSF